MERENSLSKAEEKERKRERKLVERIVVRERLMGESDWMR